MEQLHLFNLKLAKLDRPVDKKLAEVDVVLTSVGTSLLSMEDSIMSAIQALLAVDMIKGWVKDTVVLEQLAAHALMAPPIPSPWTPSGAMMPPLALQQCRVLQLVPGLGTYGHMPSATQFLGLTSGPLPRIVGLMLTGGY
jgi:hypothetical protein